MSKRNQYRGPYSRVSLQWQEPVASPMAPEGAPAALHKEGVVVVYVHPDTSVENVTGSHEEQEEMYAKLATSDGYPRDGVFVYRETWSGAACDSPQLAELRRMSAAGDLQVLYVCWDGRTSRCLDGLTRLLSEFVASGVLVYLVDDPRYPASKSKWRYFVPKTNRNNLEEGQHAC